MRCFRLETTRRKARVRSAGFTLVELMVVVAITGILATIGIALVRGHVDVAKANRALSGIQAIRAAEEAFRAQNGQYLDCSGTTTNWYPNAAPNKTTYAWRQPTRTDSYACWMALGVTGITSTQYGFLVTAGNPSVAYPTLQTATKPTLTAPTDHWYVIQVKGDINGNGVPMLGVATSLNGEVYIEHEGE